MPQRVRVFSYYDNFTLTPIFPNFPLGRLIGDPNTDADLVIRVSCKVKLVKQRPTHQCIELPTANVD